MKVIEPDGTEQKVHVFFVFFVPMCMEHVFSLEERKKEILPFGINMTKYI